MPLRQEWIIFYIRVTYRAEGTNTYLPMIVGDYKLGVLGDLSTLYKATLANLKSITL